MGLCLDCFNGIPSNPREEMGVWRNPYLAQIRTKRPAKLVFKRQPLRKVIDPMAVIESVSAAYAVDQKNLTTRCQSPIYSEPRHAAMFILWKVSRLSYPAVARIFGYHHTTVLYAVRQTQRRIEQDEQFGAAIRGLEEQFLNPLKEENSVLQT